MTNGHESDRNPDSKNALSSPSKGQNIRQSNAWYTRDRQSIAQQSQFQSDIGSEFNIVNAYQYDDLEHVSLIQKTDTNSFVRRVYLTVTFQMIFATLLTGIFTRYKSKDINHIDKTSVTLIATGGCLFTVFILVCYRELIRQVPCNYIMLMIQTLCQGYILSLTIYLHEPSRDVFSVFIITSVTFTGMTINAFLSTRDIQPKQSLMIGVIMCMLSYMVVVILYEDSDLFYLFFSCMGILLAVVFVVFDSQMIIRSKRHGITQDDYIMAAMILYIDPFCAIGHVIRIVFKI